MTSRTDNGISAHLTSILCWTFLPSLFTNLLLSTFYRFSPGSRPTLPPHASPHQVASANSTAQRHFRRARITLVVSYLAYSILNVYWSQISGVNQNYYSLLGLSRQVVETEGASSVKSQWRKLARIYHPDKVGKGGEARFVELRRGVDILENDGKRWAYERFGPSIMEWGKLGTNREFLVKGATNAAAFWVFAFLSIVGISFFRKDERRNNFWRYLTLVLSASLEFHFLLRASPSPTFSFLFPNRLTYEHIALLRQIFISVSMAMSQLTPLLFPLELSLPPSPERTEEQARILAFQDAVKLKPVLSRLATLTAAAHIEATGLQHLELRPLVLLSERQNAEEVQHEEVTQEEMEKRKREIVEGVKRQMKITFEDLQLKSNPVTGQVWENAVKNGRERRMKPIEAVVVQSDEGRKVEIAQKNFGKEAKEEKDEKDENAEEADPVEPKPFVTVPSPPTSPIPVLKTLTEGNGDITSEAKSSKPHDSTGSFAHLPSPPPEVESEGAAK